MVSNGSVRIPGWIQWGAGVILTTMGLGAFAVSWAYTTFPEKAAIERRLERIEDLLVQVIQNQQTRGR